MLTDIKVEVETTTAEDESGSLKETKADDATSEEKPLTFKDWKSYKQSQNKLDDKTPKINLRPKDKTKRTNSNNYNNKNNRFGNNDADFNRGGSSFQVPQNFFGNNNFGLPNFNSFPALGFNNNFNGRGNNFPNNNFNGPNNFNGKFNGGPNNFNGSFNGGPNNFNGNFNSGPNNFNGNFNGGPNNFNGNFNGPNNNFSGNFNGPNNNFNGPNNNNFNGNFHGSNNRNNLDFPDSFFASDGIYRQRDMMQKPLADDNPFKNDQKANMLLNKLHNSEFAKPLKNKNSGDQQKAGCSRQQGGNKMQRGKNSNFSEAPISQDNTKLGSQPKIYLANPNGNTDGKQPSFLPKPSLPENNPDLTFEQRKQQWKEYREAMKPFKNRDFYNARRVVQRLGKKDPKELDEKQIIRLANAREIMANHKERLASKYPNYIKADESPKELGELYVLQKKPLKDWEKNPGPFSAKQYQNYGNFGCGPRRNFDQNSNYNSFGSGRKIVGGYSGFRGFVSGGLLQGSGQRF